MSARYCLWYPSPSDPAALETWLTDQAARGWRLVPSRWGMKLERRAPAALRYHLEPALRGDTPEEELLEDFARGGWTYVRFLTPGFHVFVSDLPQPEEPHTDPAALGWAIGRLAHNRGVDLAFLVVVWGLYFFLRGKNSRFTLVDFLELDAVSQLLWLLLQVVWVALLLGGTAVEWLRLRRLRRRLAAGVPLPQTKSWRRKRAFWLASLLLFFLLLGASLTHAAFRPSPWQRAASLPAPALSQAAEAEQPGYLLEELLLTEGRLSLETPDGGTLTCRYLSPGIFTGAVWRSQLEELKDNVLEQDLEIKEEGEGGWTRLALARDLLGRQYLLAQGEALFLRAEYDGTGALEDWLPELTEAALRWKEGL